MAPERNLLPRFRRSVRHFGFKVFLPVPDEKERKADGSGRFCTGFSDVFHGEFKACPRLITRTELTVALGLCILGRFYFHRDQFPVFLQQKIDLRRIAGAPEVSTFFLGNQFVQNIVFRKGTLITQKRRVIRQNGFRSQT